VSQPPNALELPSQPEAARARERFAEIAASPDADIDVATAALWIAAESCAGLDVSAYRERLDALGDEVGRALAGDLAREEPAAAIADELFRTHGYRGERVDYYDPRNSFLNCVLDRRRGIPISLCVLYVTVARRNGLRADGISFPGHFLARVELERGAAAPFVVVDAFEGRTVTRAECRERLKPLLGPQAELTEALLRAAPNKEILFRMLSNLKTVFINTHQYEQALACCDRGLLLAPDHALEHRDRGLVYQRLDCIRPAVTDLERYVALAPEDPGVPAVRSLLDALRRQLPSVH